MKSTFRQKSSYQLVLVYVVVFAVFALFAASAVVALNRVIQYYTERETAVFSTNLQLDLDAQMEKTGSDLTDPEVRHLLEICASLHDLDIVVTDRSGLVQVSSVRELVNGELLFAQRSVFSPTEPYLMRGGALHFIDGAWVKDGGILDVTYCSTRPVIGTDSRMVILSRNGRLMAVLKHALEIFFLALLCLFVVAVLLMQGILFGYRRRIIELATVDELTGLANRKSFIIQYTEQSRRGLPDGALLFMLDVDKFKQINDGYGHAVGDKALSFVARHVQSMMNGSCLAGRWGGDEFIGVYTGGRVEAGEKLKRLLREVRETPIPLEDGRELHLTVSIGAVPIDSGQSLNKNLERADAALYQSKNNGRDCLTVLQPGKTV